MYWNVDNFHVYERHIPKLQEQIDRYREHVPSYLTYKPLELIFPENWDDSNFFNNRLSEARIEGYTYIGKYKYKFEIAI